MVLKEEKCGRFDRTCVVLQSFTQHLADSSLWVSLEMSLKFARSHSSLGVFFGEGPAAAVWTAAYVKWGREITSEEGEEDGEYKPSAHRKGE